MGRFHFSGFITKSEERKKGEGHHSGSAKCEVLCYLGSLLDAGFGETGGLSPKVSPEVSYAPGDSSPAPSGQIRIARMSTQGDGCTLAAGL